MAKPKTKQKANMLGCVDIESPELTDCYNNESLSTFVDVCSANCTEDAGNRSDLLWKYACVASRF